MIRFLTAGESHGKELVGILEGIPANVEIDMDFINNELKRRQKGYGRSERMDMEKDEMDIISGINNGKTTGNPISFKIKNKGYLEVLEKIYRPRPGHGDLSGAIKYNQDNVRNVLERASARETAARVGTGSICKTLLKNLNIEIYSHVIQVGGIVSEKSIYEKGNIEDIKEADKSIVRVVDSLAEEKIVEKIKSAKKKGDTLGGTIELIAVNIPVGLGSYASWDSRLDGKIAQSIMSIPGIKAVEIGNGLEGGKSYGSQVHDEIYYEEKYFRKTNNAGGIEAGVSNGEDIVVRCTMKPIPTLRQPLNSVDMTTKLVSLAQVERSDVLAVPSASIVAESMLAYTIAQEIMRKFGGDSIEELKRNYFNYIDGVSSR